MKALSASADRSGVTDLACSEWEAWLGQRVGFHKKQSGKGEITYPAALDEALCFGWIDDVRKSGDASTSRP